MKPLVPITTDPPMSDSIAPDRIARCYETVRTALLAERNAAGHWEGRLSQSALSTATAVMALEMVRGDQGERGVATPCCEYESLIKSGLRWLADHQNDDGGWGDTVKSLSNASTSMLAHAVFHATGTLDEYGPTVEAARQYIDQIGGVAAVRARYGKDKTFSIPILTHCALAGLVDWREVDPLPFELACLPSRFYKRVRLPVVSYALPALIAIGQVRHHFRKPSNPLFRLIRWLAIRPSLRALEKIQPPNGGFLEATPLTSFVTMSLAGMGMSDHPVVRRGVEFIINSVSDDGSWPIDTNLSTWVTTLSVNALKDHLPAGDRDDVRDWLLKQQYLTVHPYTNADPGGWAWTDLPGGVPDADDTSGALLALVNLRGPHGDDSGAGEEEDRAFVMGVGWLLDLQNRNGGWPTFCRGWGALPFDRSAADLTAHAIRALITWLTNSATRRDRLGSAGANPLTSHNRLVARAEQAIQSGFGYLAKSQRNDGSWLPLWFGNQFGHDDENPTYGTARALAAYRDAGRLGDERAERGFGWLRSAQNNDGGWGGAAGITSSVEETALATEILISVDPHEAAAKRGLAWLLDRVEQGTFRETSPIGFYFAKLWYFEELYPLTFIVAALGRADRLFNDSSQAESPARFRDTPHKQPVFD